MKVRSLLVFGLLCVMGCSSAVLSASGKMYHKNVNGTPLSCAVINEWDVSSVRPDNKTKGCWCMFPPMSIPNVGMSMLFVLMKDEICKEESVEKSQPEQPKQETEERL